jgi:hypothetical protein
MSTSTFLMRLLEHVRERLGRVRHHGDRRGLLRDQILDDLDLLLRADVVGTFLTGIDTRALCEVLDSDLHAVEPRDALELDDSDHGHVLGGERCARTRTRPRSRRAARGTAAHRSAACEQSRSDARDRQNSQPSLRHPFTPL